MNTSQDSFEIVGSQNYMVGGSTVLKVFNYWYLYLFEYFFLHSLGLLQEVWCWVWVHLCYCSCLLNWYQCAGPISGLRMSTWIIATDVFCSFWWESEMLWFFFRDTVHCKLYSLNSSNRRTTLLFLHGQTETERTWAARLTSSAISSHCGTLLITCALMSIWSFCCFFFSCSALLSVVIILVLQQGASIGKVRNKEGRRKYFQQTSEREKANGWLDVAADRCQKVFAGVNEKEDSKEKQCRLIILNVFWISVF